MIKKIFITLLIAYFSSSFATGISEKLIKKSAPRVYIVKPNDTIVGIAHKYLLKISYWPQFMDVDSWSNALLYPGDKIQLLRFNHKRLLVTDRENTAHYEKLKKRTQSSTKKAIDSIDTDKIKSLLRDVDVVNLKEFLQLPRVIAGENAGQRYYSYGDKIYVKNYHGKVGDRVSLYSPFRELAEYKPTEHKLKKKTGRRHRDKQMQEQLNKPKIYGYEIRLDGSAIVNQIINNIAVLELHNVKNQITKDDRVEVYAPQRVPIIIPHHAKNDITGHIIGLYDAIDTTAENSVVVLDVGESKGIDVGTVFNALLKRKVVNPDRGHDNEPDYIELPASNVAELLVYKVFDDVSYALITDSTRPVHLFQEVGAQN